MPQFSFPKAILLRKGIFLHFVRLIVLLIIVVISLGLAWQSYTERKSVGADIDREVTIPRPEYPDDKSGQEKSDTQGTALKEGLPMTPDLIDTSDWRIYRSDKLGVEVTYPAFLQVATEVACIIPASGGEALQNDSGLLFRRVFDYEFGIFTNFRVLVCTVEENFEDLASYYWEGLRNPIIISGHRGFKILYGAEEVAGEIYYLEREERSTVMIDVSFYREYLGIGPAANHEDYIEFIHQQAITDQMLSMFQITDPSE